MDFEEIKNNLLDALGKLMALRVIITSPSEKVADLPALYAIFAVLLAPWAVVIIVLLGLVFRYAVRFETDATKR